MTAIQFGLNVSTSASPSRDPVAEARRAEELGFDFVSSNDHPCGTAPTFETWTLLTWMAAATSRIKVASRVLGVPYRPPPMVAKMAETLDRLSQGRFILGMGGGYSDEEFRAFGLAVPSPKDKVEGLEEAVRITRGLWSERSFTFDGRHHRVLAADVEPKPDHDIPIWLGSLGPRSLAVTGRVADGWIPSLENAPPEKIPHMRDTIYRAAEGAGRDPQSITLVYNLEIRIEEDADVPEHVVSGSPDAVVESLAGFKELGFTGFNFQPVGPDHDKQVEQLALKVIPTLRG